MIKEISAKDNRIIKLMRTLHTRSGRKKQSLYFVEGLRIVKDTIEYAGDKIEFIIFSESFYSENKILSDKYSEKHMCYLIPDFLFDDISDTTSPQGILAVLKINTTSLSDILPDRILILDCIQDPGNMGTIIRTAEAMGFDAIFFTKGCADIYSPKVLRSAMGSAFRISFYFADSISDIKALKEKGYSLYSAALNNNSVFLKDTRLSEKTAIVIGNEANGISDEILELSDYVVKIPMKGKIESLNAAVAASIIMYHFTIN